MDLIEVVAHLALQLAVILIAAKLAAELCVRYLKISPVLGELAVGMMIGPYALGNIDIPWLGPVFEALNRDGLQLVPVSTELYAFAEVAAVVLLFVVGLETDLALFLRFAGPAFAVATGGVLLPFLFGIGATVLFGFADGFGSATALFIGAIMTATSVGITARVLTERAKLGTPEGVTILAAAVIDDVLGILVLTVVVGISGPEGVSAGKVVVVGAKALGFWIVLTAGGILLSGYISRWVKAFRASGAAVSLALALALLAAALAEKMGLAMIIGAYSMGLALSQTELKSDIEEQIQGVGNFLIPVFFVVMGMLVDFSAMGGALAFGAVLSALAIVSKVVGCGLPALATGFNGRGAWRIGIGMLPRGEVALIIAGIGLTRAVIGTDLFGVAIMMTVITTLLAPPILVRAFEKGGVGLRVHSKVAPTAEGEKEP